MRVQRVAASGSAAESWTLLDDDHLPVGPVEQFLAHLSDQDRSPNTVRAYAFDLKDYFTYLRSRKLNWAQLRYDELAGVQAVAAAPAGWAAR